jgi:hypothetical protein
VHDPKIPPITQFEVCKPLEPTSSPYLPHISRLRHQIPHLCDYHLRLPYLSKASCRNLPERWASLASARFFYIGSCPGLPQAGTSSCYYVASYTLVWHGSKPHSTREHAQHTTALHICAGPQELLASVFSRKRSEYVSLAKLLWPEVQPRGRPSCFLMFGYKSIHRYLMISSVSRVYLQTFFRIHRDHRGSTGPISCTWRVAPSFQQ